jgi:hypothetical protein
VRTAADLDDASTGGDADLIEEPARLVCELLRLLLQPLLFRLSVAENILVGLGHDGSPLCEYACSWAGCLGVAECSADLQVRRDGQA